MPDVINSGEWIVYIVTDNFAKNINLAFAKLNSVDNGITYRPIAQLATQLVSGNNYAVLAEKSSVWEPHVKKYVLVTFYAKLGAKEPNDILIYTITPLKAGQFTVTIPNGQIINISKIIPITDNVQAVLGGWDIDVKTKDWPKDVDKTIDLLNNQLGARYKPIAYLGEQLVHGHNYAILAEQTLITLPPSVSIVLIIFNVNEKDEIHIVSIEKILESYGPALLGGELINPTTEIPEVIMNEFNSVMEHFVGSDVKPFAYLGDQIVSGIDRFLAAEVTAVVPDAKPKISLVVINAKEKSIQFKDIL